MRDFTTTTFSLSVDGTIQPDVSCGLQQRTKEFFFTNGAGFLRGRLSGVGFSSRMRSAGSPRDSQGDDRLIDEFLLCRQEETFVSEGAPALVAADGVEDIWGRTL
jgi:hypothetical protein